MDPEFIPLILTFVGTFLILVATTMGCVLFVRFVAGRLSTAVRTILAAISAIIVMYLPMSFVAFDGQTGGQADEIWMFLFLTAGVSFVVAWLVSYVATARLDRLTEFDAKEFL